MTSSPPPLRHPVPTHPAYIPEPPSTPASPPAGYQRYSSSPQPGPTGQPAHAQQYVPAYPFQNPAAPGPQNLAQQPQPSHFGGPIPGWNMNNMGVDSATAQLGMQLGSSAVAAGQEYVQKNVRVTCALSYRQPYIAFSCNSSPKPPLSTTSTCQTPT